MKISTLKLTFICRHFLWLLYIFHFHRNEIKLKCCFRLPFSNLVDQRLCCSFCFSFQHFVSMLLLLFMFCLHKQICICSYLICFLFVVYVMETSIKTPFGLFLKLRIVQAKLITWNKFIYLISKQQKTRKEKKVETLKYWFGFHILICAHSLSLYLLIQSDEIELHVVQL